MTEAVHTFSPLEQAALNKMQLALHAPKPTFFSYTLWLGLLLLAVFILIVLVYFYKKQRRKKQLRALIAHEISLCSTQTDPSQIAMTVSMLFKRVLQASKQAQHQQALTLHGQAWADYLQQQGLDADSAHFLSEALYQKNVHNNPLHYPQIQAVLEKILQEDA